MIVKKRKEKEMGIIFENSGKIMKKLASILFVIESLILIICTIDFLWDELYYEFDVWPSIGILLGVELFIFISSLVLYAFGDITENIKMMEIGRASCRERV